MKLRKNDFLRTESPAKKMMGGRKYLQEEGGLSAQGVAATSCLQGHGWRAVCRAAGNHETV